jgi:hypothetical protein
MTAICKTNPISSRCLSSLRGRPLCGRQTAVPVVPAAAWVFQKPLALRPCDATRRLHKRQRSSVTRSFGGLPVNRSELRCVDFGVYEVG